MFRQISTPSYLTLRAAGFGVGALLAAAMLVACGGSGSLEGPGAQDPGTNPDPGPVPETITLSAAQGIWQSAQGADVNTSAIVLPDGAMWAVLSQGTGSSATTRVVKAKLKIQEGDLKATGKSYLLGGAAVTMTEVPVTASVVEKVSLTAQLGPVADAGGSQVTESLALAWQERYETRTQLTELAGAWTAIVGPGSINWRVDAQGNVEGTRTTGCTYAGQLSARLEAKAVVDVELKETCQGTSSVALSGVAVPRDDGRRLSLVMTTDNEANAVLFALTR